MCRSRICSGVGMSCMGTVFEKHSNFGVKIARKKTFALGDASYTFVPSYIKNGWIVFSGAG
jgi:hypothetical protein